MPDVALAILHGVHVQFAAGDGEKGKEKRERREKRKRSSEIKW